MTPPAPQRPILLMKVPGVIYGIFTRQTRHWKLNRALSSIAIVKVSMTSIITDLILITLHSSIHYIRSPSTGYHPFLSSSINLSISTFYFILATTTIWAHPAGTASPIVAPPQQQQSAHEVSSTSSTSTIPLWHILLCRVWLRPWWVSKTLSRLSITSTSRRYLYLNHPIHCIHT